MKDKIKQLKLRDLRLKEECTREKARRKEAEHRLKAIQKERYIQALKLKNLETKLEKMDAQNQADKRKQESNTALRKEVEALKVRLVEREKALSEHQEAYTKLRRKYQKLKRGGTEESSLEELQRIEQVVERSRNALLERIKKKLKEEMDDRAKCVICCDKQKGIIFVPCGHRVCCVPCSEKVRTCPICRANIEIRQKVFE